MSNFNSDFFKTLAQITKMGGRRMVLLSCHLVALQLNIVLVILLPGPLVTRGKTTFSQYIHNTFYHCKYAWCCA